MGIQGFYKFTIYVQTEGGYINCYFSVWFLAFNSILFYLIAYLKCIKINTSD